ADSCNPPQRRGFFFNFHYKKNHILLGGSGHKTLRRGQHVALAPLRNDVPLLDPCCGQLSAGAEVDLGVKGRQKFIGFRHVPSALWVPPGFRERPQTAPNPSGVSVDLSEDKAWNSRRIPDAVLRARLNGKTQIIFKY
uniref:Uncharacterized protein n=1 Tax=Lates calcarifer TaxID=8187 RepID=A0A4W6D1V9_LATCA